jgi:nucleoside-diphosphate-sugar epimerase
MAKALIGFTGFVGGNLDRQQSFDDRYNSKNIQTIDGKQYDLLVCAGVPAVKWLANKEPEQDRKVLAGLRDHLSRVSADKVVLISTVDVYPYPVDVDEFSPIDIDSSQPYGKHRLEFEQFVSEQFDSLIVRLPGLFGHGLKKNVIYDFLHDNEVFKINLAGVFQFYYLEHLTRDIEIAINNGLKLINFATEPTSVAEVARICLGHEFENEVDAPAAVYNYRSRYAELYGGKNGYLYDKQQVLNDLKAYVRQEKD